MRRSLSRTSQVPGAPEHRSARGPTATTSLVSRTRMFSFVLNVCVTSARPSARPYLQQQLEEGRL